LHGVDSSLLFFSLQRA